MKCQILFSGKNKKNFIDLSSAENAQRVLKIFLLVWPILSQMFDISRFHICI